MNTAITDAQVDAAIEVLERAIEAARNSNQAGEDAVLKMANGLDMHDALALHQAWADSERAGPDYGEQTRDTHPDGERIWRQWWDANLDLCDRAQRATLTALSKARGEP